MPDPRGPRYHGILDVPLDQWNSLHDLGGRIEATATTPGTATTDQFYYDTFNSFVATPFTADGSGNISTVLDLDDPGGGSYYSVPDGWTVEPGSSGTDGLYVPPGAYAIHAWIFSDTDLDLVNAISAVAESPYGSVVTQQLAHPALAFPFGTGLQASISMTLRLYERPDESVHEDMGWIKFLIAFSGLGAAQTVNLYFIITVTSIGDGGGTVGAQGLQGPPGDDGPQGDPGADGADGNNEDSVEIQVTLPTAAPTTGDGKAYFMVPAHMNGYNLIAAHAGCVTAPGSSGFLIQIHNVTQGADMLSTRIGIDSGEQTSYTAGTPPVIDTSNDDVATGDLLRIDIDHIGGSATRGVIVFMRFGPP